MFAGFARVAAGLYKSEQPHLDAVLFNSLEFLIFFPLVVLAYFALPYRYRWMLLLAASYYFYMSWKVAYAALLVTTTVVAYLAALWMDGTEDPRRRRHYLIFSLVVNLGILFVFKYFNLFADTGTILAQSLGAGFHFPHLDVLLPVGISFYTFQTLSYSIDVYRGERRSERHLGIFALYVSFFPQLVAGPIERSTTLLPQFKKNFDFDYRRVTDGLKLMAWGFFKKLVIADRLGIYVDQVYNSPGEYSSIPLIIATVFFAYQIYCDFSGYSDIAIGAAQVMGYDLMQNFRQPYFSKNIQEFWRRWHVSLSTWFRDYLYIPLGGSRTTVSRWYLNLFIVFVVSGLWHGANWTFVMWGALHGGYLVFGLWTRKWRAKLASACGLSSRPRLHKLIQISITMGLVLFAWIFFRANTIGDAFYVAVHVFTDFDFGADFYLELGAYEFWIGTVSIFLLECVHYMQRQVRVRTFIAERPAWLRWSLYYASIMYVLLFAEFGGAKFIYFQF